ncbi:ABC transporter ATP-binding protein [Geminicoccaceae bacterium 1502E]|nr:ABC transporter ATP-binding protein [Geminicoccaceae bacterium 1502E]
MMKAKAGNGCGDVLLQISGLRIEGRSGDGWSEIVKGIDLVLRRGEVLGLIGESGAGKSTIGLAAMGYARSGCRITDGLIVFDDTDLLKLSETERLRLRGVRIAYVAQSAAASFNPAHRLIDQYAEVATTRGVMSREQARAEAVTLFRELQLPDPETIGERYPHQVSGGQLQRAMIAMAMACRPDIIVFDEPTTALDVTTQIEVLVAIKNVVEAHQTAAIYISHDLAVVAQLADRIMVLRHGRLVEEGETRSLLENPAQDYTRQLLAVRTPKREVRPEKETLLEIRGIAASYGATPVLEGVDIRVPRGRTVAVVGESGSGKSTLARVVTGLLPPRKGEILFEGKVLSPALKGRDADLLRRIQMIYQMPDTALNPRQRVREILGRPLSFYLGLKGAAQDARILELLEQLELGPDHIDRYPGELSGGQKQRICIARALAAQPDLIICDEVTSALDQLVAEDILKLLLRLQKTFDLSYLFITHDIATVRAIADDIVVMHKGRVVEQGPKAEILVPPHHEYTERLLSSVPEMSPDWLKGLRSSRPLVGDPLG